MPDEAGEGQGHTLSLRERADTVARDASLVDPFSKENPGLTPLDSFMDTMQKHYADFRPEIDDGGVLHFQTPRGSGTTLQVDDKGNINVSVKATDIDSERIFVVSSTRVLRGLPIAIALASCERTGFDRVFPEPKIVNKAIVSDFDPETMVFSARRSQTYGEVVNRFTLKGNDIRQLKRNQPI